MELINATRMIAGYTMGMEPSGRELLVVAVKGTFQIPEEREAIRLADEQVPLAMSDVFFGEPGRSAPRYEANFAPRKMRCDVLLNASACAPDGRPATRTRVGVRIGDWAKVFTVVGDRVWQVTASGIEAGSPEPFLRANHLRPGVRRHRRPARGPVPARGLHEEPQRSRLSQTPEARVGGRLAAAEHRGGREACHLARRRLSTDVVRPDWPPLGAAVPLRGDLRRAVARGALPVPAPGFRRAVPTRRLPSTSRSPIRRGERRSCS